MSKSTRNTGKAWTPADVKELKNLAKENTPTRVIGLKLGRTPGAVQQKASREDISLKPANQSPYNRQKKRPFPMSNTRFDASEPAAADPSGRRT